MNLAVVVAWLLTAVFAVLVLPCVLRLARLDYVHLGPDVRNGDLAELLLVVAMIAMLSPVGAPIPAAGWQAILALTTGWFAVTWWRSRSTVVPVAWRGRRLALAASFVRAIPPTHGPTPAGDFPLAHDSSAAMGTAPVEPDAQPAAGAESTFETSPVPSAPSAPVTAPAPPAPLTPLSAPTPSTPGRSLPPIAPLAPPVSLAPPASLAPPVSLTAAVPPEPPEPPASPVPPALSVASGLSFAETPSASARSAVDAVPSAAPSASLTPPAPKAPFSHCSPSDPTRHPLSATGPALCGAGTGAAAVPRAPGCGHHALSAAAMLYMVTAMPHGGMAHGPWLTMSAVDAGLALPAVAILGAVYFAADAVWSGFLAVRTRGRYSPGFTPHTTCRAVMGAGMGYMLLAAV